MAEEKLDITTALRDYTALVTEGRDPIHVKDGTHPCVLTPPGYQIAYLDRLIFNEYAERPHRTKQAVTALDPRSFIEYWTSFHDPGSRIFGDRDGKRFHAVLDYHQSADGVSPALPRWGSHTLTLQLKHTEEWLTWTANHEKDMQQSAMALFIEDNAPDFVEPSAARMFEIASRLEATSEVKFDSSVDLQNGSRKLKYHEETKATAGGEMEVPKEFTIRIPIFEGMPKVEIKARFRYKIPGGKLTLSYSLFRRGEAERQAFEQVLNVLSEECGSVLLGKP